jgi:K+-transporting ATPase ATPase C chain
MSQLRPAFVSIAALTLITGLAYPLAMTGAGRILFPSQSQGSLITSQGKIIGSKLIGQFTEDPRYFWGRLSATADSDGKPLPYNADNSGGSNLAPSNPDLRKAAEARIQALKAADPGNSAPIPVDLVTASASGVDPNITPAAASYQVRRVAATRHIPEVKVRELVAQASQGRFLGLVGEPRVNVLELNLAL